MYFSSDLRQGVGRGLSSRPPSKSKWNCTAGGRAIIVYRRVARSAWKCVYVRRQNMLNMDVYFFVCFFPLTAAAVHEKPCEAVKRLLLFPLRTNGGAFHGNQGAVTHKARRKVRAKGSSPITSQVSLFCFFLLPAAGELCDFSDFRREQQRRSAVHVYRGGMDKQHRHVRCCAANKPPRWPDDSGYTWKWVKTRKARENAGDVAEDSWWRNCVYFKLQLFLLADLLHSASFFCFSHQILQCLMPDSGDFAKKRGRCY